MNRAYNNFGGMSMRLNALSLVAVFALAACGGGGGGSRGGSVLPGSSTNTPQSSKQAKVSMKIVIANSAGASLRVRKHPAFVSPSTNGVLVVTYAHSDTNHSTPLGSIATNVSSGSSACVTTGGSRSCTVVMSVPPGDDDFVYTLYDAAPVNGTIPNTADILGVATVSGVTITAGIANTVNANVSAVITGLSGQSNVNIASVPQSIALMVSPTDFGNNPITAGPNDTPYANPITIAVSETGGSGHTLLSLNGGTAAASVTSTKASDTVSAVYDGLASSGYAATVTLSAAAYGGEPAANETASITPQLFVTNASTAFYSLNASNWTLATYPQGQHVLLINEPNAVSGTTYTATPSGCSGILSVGTVIGTGTNATLLVVGGTTTPGSGCTLSISDGNSNYTFPIAVTDTLRTDSAVHTITEYTTTLNQPFGITTGADGNLWVGDQASGVSGTGTIAHIQTDGTNESNISLSGFVTPWFDSLGPDGAVWIGDDNSFQVAKITTGGTVTQTTANNMWTNFTAAGLDGNEWFSECNNHFIGDVNTKTAAYTETSITNGESQGISLGPDENIWALNFSTEALIKVLAGVPSNVVTLSSMPFAIASGSDGNLWITEGSSIQRSTPSGTLSAQFSLPSGGDARQIVAGPDGNLWFTDLTNGAVGMITTSGVVTEYSIPSSNSEPEGITVGPDGNIWFAETGTRKIAKLKL